MNTEFIQGELSKFNVADAVISDMKTQFTALKIDGIKDTKGYKAVHAALMTVKGKRVEVEKKRKELKADSLAFGRAVDAEAKRITALLKPIEDHLAGEKQAILDEKARIKAEKEQQERAELEAKIRAEQEAKAAEEKARLEAAALAEAERLAKIEAEQEAERQRLAAIAQEQSRKEAEREVKREAERQALEAERQEIQAEKERLAVKARETEQHVQVEEPEPDPEPEAVAPAPVLPNPEPVVQPEPQPEPDLITALVCALKDLAMVVEHDLECPPVALHELRAAKAALARAEVER